jgi:hypothetical protein
MLLAPSVSRLFKCRQFEPEVILLAVDWYLRFSLSYRDVEELLAERGLHADHVTVWRWVQRYVPEMERLCALSSDRPTIVGEWTEPTSGSRASSKLSLPLEELSSLATTPNIIMRFYTNNGVSSTNPNSRSTSCLHIARSLIRPKEFGNSHVASVYTTFSSRISKKSPIGWRNNLTNGKIQMIPSENFAH